jgi:hypothetical protein
MSLSITARILWQGPQAPAAGDGFTLSVYDYEVVTPDSPLHVGELIQVAHLEADADDPGFAVGQLRRLALERDIPPGASLLYASRQERSAPPWYCPASSPVGERE